MLDCVFASSQRFALKCFEDFFACFVDFKSTELGWDVVSHFTVVANYLNPWKIMAGSDIKIIRVMRRSDLNGTCTVFRVDIVIGNDRDFAASQR